MPAHAIVLCHTRFCFHLAQVMVWGSARMIIEAGVTSVWAVDFFLRPHHLASDFQPLLAETLRAFQKLAAAHSCQLFLAVPSIIVDGKWCLQVSLCNERESNCEWVSALNTGYITGCTSRPKRGSKYCERHQLPAPVDETAALPTVEAHREVVTNDRVSLQYQLEDGSWVESSALPLMSIRKYELDRLPKWTSQSSADDAESCSKDPRRGTQESFISRKSGGILVAVAPCLHIVGIKPLTSTESLTQVLLFVWSILSYLPGMVWVLYDFACGMVRFIRSQVGKRCGAPELSNWLKLQEKKWVVDKLHFFTGHKGCSSESGYSYSSVLFCCHSNEVQTNQRLTRSL
jgi:hypothetical protein